MVALTRGANRPYRSSEVIDFPVAANTQIWEGGLVQLNSGLLIPAQSGTSGDEAFPIVGMADESVDNNPGTAGQRRCLVRKATPGCLFRFATAADLTNAMIGTIFDVMDDNTLQATAANAAPAGKLIVIADTRVGWFDLFDTFTRP